MALWIMLQCWQRTPLFFSFLFSDAATDLFGERLQTADLEKMEKDLHRSLALLERDFPVNMQNIVSHFCITYFQK